MRLSDMFGVVRTLPFREGESGAKKRNNGVSGVVDEGES